MFWFDESILIGWCIRGVFRVWVLSVPLGFSKTEFIPPSPCHLSLFPGHYDARARVLICHMTSLFHLPLEELELLEETFLESLKETREEESE